jgi:hypothetical protein
MERRDPFFPSPSYLVSLTHTAQRDSSRVIIKGAQWEIPSLAELNEFCHCPFSLVYPTALRLRGLTPV